MNPRRLTLSIACRAAIAGVASGDATLVSACGNGESATAVDAALWAQYVIEPGQHDATVSGGSPENPLRGFQTIAGRDYDFAFDPSAAYVITQPTQPEDQLDWNKLPGLSDCGTIDLAVDGAMFGWRWRVDLAPPVLEVTAYANATSVHQWPTDPLFALSADELAADAPLHYRVWPDGDVFRFSVDGTIGTRTIDVGTTLSRACPATPALDFKWAAGLYFGGTSVAPTRITGRVSERAFR